MATPVHIICGRCGSLDVKFLINEPDPPMEDEPGSCGVSLSCDDCGTLTSVEEMNERKSNWKRGLK